VTVGKQGPTAPAAAAPGLFQVEVANPRARTRESGTRLAAASTGASGMDGGAALRDLGLQRPYPCNPDPAEGPGQAVDPRTGRSRPHHRRCPSACRRAWEPLGGYPNLLCSHGLIPKAVTYGGKERPRCQLAAASAAAHRASA
jgi:hypothetical protein